MTGKYIRDYHYDSHYSSGAFWLYLGNDTELEVMLRVGAMFPHAHMILANKRKKVQSWVQDDTHWVRISNGYKPNPIKKYYVIEDGAIVEMPVELREMYKDRVISLLRALMRDAKIRKLRIKRKNYMGFDFHGD